MKNRQRNNWRLDVGRLETAREESGLTQAGIAGMIEITKQQWQQWIRGEITPSIPKFVRICRATGKPPAYFFVDGVPHNE